MSPGFSQLEVFIIISIPKKLDPIDSSTGPHQDEGNSGYIDPASDYLPN
jgi:hypothetical protein